MKIRETLKRQVMREAGNLRRLATKEEKSRLKITGLDPINQYSCIYGQMTGDCFGPRAGVLLGACGVPVATDIYHAEEDGPDPYKWMTPHKEWKKDPDKLRNREDFFMSVRDYASAIEFYITLPGAKTRNLVNFIKGKTHLLFL